MKFLKKLAEIFKRTKNVTVEVEANVSEFIQVHKKQIKVLMNLLEIMFPAGTGIKKMTCLVTNVCAAIGIDMNKITPTIAEYVAGELQKQYDKFKEELNKSE